MTKPVATRPKPKLRGVSHLIGFFVALAAGALLVAAAPPGLARTTTGIYVASLAALLGISAVYHVPMWKPKPRSILRRLDHAAIYLLIAGTYTPIASMVLGSRGGPLLVLVWTGAAFGIVKSVAWPAAPRWLTASLYVLLGWCVVWEWKSVLAGIGPAGAALIAAGGIAYTVGAVVYAGRRPNPAPTTFGYHEIFHALVLLAAALHFECVRRLVLAS